MEIWQELFRSERSPCLKRGMTLEHFHSLGKANKLIDRLKIEQAE